MIQAEFKKWAGVYLFGHACGIESIDEDQIVVVFIYPVGKEFVAAAAVDCHIGVEGQMKMTAGQIDDFAGIIYAVDPGFGEVVMEKPNQRAGAYTDHQDFLRLVVDQ